MNYSVVALRLIHVFSGVFWVGSALFIAFFITPVAEATADTGQKFMMHLITKSRFTMVMTASAFLTVLAGGTLYWIDSGGFASGWTGSATGWGFGVGGIFGVVGLIFGSMVGRYSSMLGKIGSQIQGKPTPAQTSQIQTIQKQLKIVSAIDTIALIVALVCMATARYW
ncbi:MAG TPA: hypothetical protein VIN60_03185 [Anaerolineales bacterium]